MTTKGYLRQSELQDCHNSTNRKKERKRYHNSLILLKYFAASAAINRPTCMAHLTAIKLKSQAHLSIPRFWKYANVVGRDWVHQPMTDCSCVISISFEDL